jgi:DNA-binding FrmR family transcriptional regulator
MEVLKQIAAVSGAVRGVGMFVLEDHLKGCVSAALRTRSDHDNEALIDQVLTIFNKFVR